MSVTQQQTQATRVGQVNTQAELQALQVKKTELEDQLKSMLDRRAQLSVQRTLARTKVAGEELDVRIAAIDERSARLERELAATDEVIVEALPRVVAANLARKEAVATVPPPGDAGAELLRTVLVAEGLGIALLALIFWQALKRYARRSVLPADYGTRLTQLQQSVDVIALEVERISESQRFLSKVMNEKLPITAGGSQP